MRLTRTNLSYEGKRIWLEDATEAQAEHMEYRHGEIGSSAHLNKENPDGKRRVEDINPAGSAGS
jgi:hypothetical protein